MGSMSFHWVIMRTSSLRACSESFRDPKLTLPEPSVAPKTAISAADDSRSSASLSSFRVEHYFPCLALHNTV